MEASADVQDSKDLYRGGPDDRSQGQGQAVDLEEFAISWFCLQFFQGLHQVDMWLAAAGCIQHSKGTLQLACDGTHCSCSVWIEGDHLLGVNQSEKLRRIMMHDDRNC